ncbi:Lipid transfer-like protein [Nymphaea thermarum]|nr:Lipid transfer-like protein [Nymphaea thermarum]
MEKFCMLLMVVVITASVGNAQDTSCLSQLASCLQFLNSTGTPSSSCCDPLKTVIKSDPVCLCNLLNSPTSSQAGISITQAEQLPQRCGENVNASACAAIKSYRNPKC